MRCGKSRRDRTPFNKMEKRFAASDHDIPLTDFSHSVHPPPSFDSLLLKIVADDDSLDELRGDQVTLSSKKRGYASVTGEDDFDSRVELLADTHTISRHSSTLSKFQTVGLVMLILVLVIVPNLTSLSFRHFAPGRRSRLMQF